MLASLFDIHGNATEWTQDVYKPYVRTQGGQATSASEDMTEINDNVRCVLRGGSFITQAWYFRCAYRNQNVPAARISDVGFRPARTSP